MMMKTLMIIVQCFRKKKKKRLAVFFVVVVFWSFLDANHNPVSRMAFADFLFSVFLLFFEAGIHPLGT